MANEDVLEELYFWIGRVERDEPGAAEYLETLAAALREAREDTKKLDWALRNGLYHDGVYINTREELAAEMKTTGGESDQ